jgi:hypothetical protein
MLLVDRSTKNLAQADQKLLAAGEGEVSAGTFHTPHRHQPGAGRGNPTSAWNNTVSNPSGMVTVAVVAVDEQLFDPCA